ncbi:IS1634 family transposase, partial [Flammeovirga aprica]
MFLRKKKNKSGSISIQVISKSSGTYKVEHSFGASKDPKILQQLEQEALSWIQKKTKQKELDFTNESNIANQVLEGISELKSVGISLLITPIFNQIGFNKIEDDLFRLLVLSRLENPLSKLATSQYYALTQSLNIDENKIYRYLDKLYREQKETIQYISYEHTRGVLGGNVSIAFYDVTTLYFETDNQDKLRKTGFSKEGKHQHPQIILGLLVSKNGYPLAYEIFEGNKFEGHTMLPLIEEFCKKY